MAHSDYTINEIKFQSFQLRDMVALYCYLVSQPTFVKIVRLVRLLRSLDVVAISEAHLLDDQTMYRIVR